jgi:hypothetical protein
VKPYTSSSLPQGVGGGGTGRITVSSTPASVSTYGMTTITATVVDGSGSAVADGTTVTFKLNNTIATLSNSTATTIGGIATVTLTAKGTTGSVTVTATSGNLSGSVTINITATATGAIGLSASPSNIPVSGTSTITARVVDTSGNPVVDGTSVSFSLDGPSMGSLSASQAVTSSGNVTVTFTASTTTGTVNITATSGTLTGIITITISSTVVGSVTVIASPSSITVRGTSSVTANVLDNSGANVPDGTTVNFILSNPTLGTITSQATTYNGNAIATFTASNTPVTATIKATSGNVSDTVNITISAAATGSIEFVSASPQVIGIRGSGQTETSTGKFLVKDINGNAVLDGTSVSFTMNGPSGGNPISEGGEYIGDIDATPTTASASTSGGFANVILHSGKVAGPVTIIAAVTGTSRSSASPTISIGGGVASATHFNLTRLPINLAGLEWSGLTSTITAFIADRFGNYNVLTGTSVSFYTEAGAIDRSDITDATGLTSVIFRTQAPPPADVVPLAWETTLQSYLNLTYGISTTAHPRDGWVTVLSTVQGEEAFNDANANGLYDLGESFTDLGEPFIDKNDDGCRNSGTQKNCGGVISSSTDPFEEYIDANGNGQYDAPNGVWDGPGCTGVGCQTSKMIWDDIMLAFTGNPAYCEISPVKFDSIVSGGSQSFKFMVGDVNVNAPIGGTTIAVTSDAGTLTGTKAYTVPDMLGGPVEISFSLINAVCTTCGKTKRATITVTVTTPAPLVTCPPVSITATLVTD